VNVVGVSPAQLTLFALLRRVLTLITRLFNDPFSETTRVSRYQKGKTSLDFTEARDGEWQWHQAGHMQVCTSLQTDNHASTPPLSFPQAGCSSCRPANSVKTLIVFLLIILYFINLVISSVCFLFTFEMFQVKRF